MKRQKRAKSKKPFRKGNRIMKKHAKVLTKWKKGLDKINWQDCPQSHKLEEKYYPKCNALFEKALRADMREQKKRQKK